jgi:hypothetical protein
MPITIVIAGVFVVLFMMVFLTAYLVDGHSMRRQPKRPVYYIPQESFPPTGKPRQEAK